MLVSGGADKIVFVWSIKEAQCLMILKGHEQGVNCLKFEVSNVKYVLLPS
jgi:WD40 repeat protein